MMKNIWIFTLLLFTIMDNLFLITGNNSFELKKFLLAWQKSATTKYGEFNVSRFSVDEKSPAEIRGELLSPPFFGDGKRIFFLEDWPSINYKNKEGSDLLLKTIKELPVETVLVLVSIHTDKRTSIYKEVAKLVKEIKEFNPWQTAQNGSLSHEGREQAIVWINSNFAQEGSSILPSAANFMLDFCGSDQWMLHQEIKKLSIFSQTEGGKKISEADIEKLCLPNKEMINFAFSAAMESGQKDKVLDVFHSLIDSNEAKEAILARDLATTIRQLLLIKKAVEKNADAKEVGIHPFVFMRLRKVANRFTFDKLKEAHRRIQKIDEELKTGRMPQAIHFFALAVERLLFELFAEDKINV